MISVDGISKTFKLYDKPSDRLKEILTGKKHHRIHNALKNISFSVADGETLGIIGQNGAGKSTLLKILIGILLPDSGSIHIDGKITGLLELGTGFNAEMTGLQNIYMNGTLLGMSNSEIKQKEDEIINFTELGYFIYEPLKTYSSGMVMRLAFSVAIHADPKCFLVDEALSVGDAYFQQKSMNKIREFRKNGGSIIFVSHDMNAVKMLCDRAILLDDGNIIEYGLPEDIVNSYNFIISLKSEKQKDMVLRKAENKSFGTFDVEIKNVEIKGEKSKSNILSSGEMAEISIIIFSKTEIANMTIGFVIRDKFGQDIFGTNTFHHNLKIDFKKNKEYKCIIKMPLNIGAGKYNITVAVHSKDTHLEHCSHWVDNVADFEIAGVVGNIFVGLCRLTPKFEFKEI